MPFGFGYMPAGVFDKDLKSRYPSRLLGGELLNFRRCGLLALPQILAKSVG